VTYLVGFWVIISLDILVITMYFASQLLDPYYPILVSPVPGLVMNSVTISLIITVVAVVMSHFRLFLDTGSVSVLLVVAATFVFALGPLNFAVVCGSDFLRAQHVDRLFVSAVLECRFEPGLCEQFKQAIGDIEMYKAQLRPFLEKYIHIPARTNEMSRAAAGMLLAWLLLDCFIMYFVFDTCFCAKFSQKNVPFPPLAFDNSQELREPPAFFGPEVRFPAGSSSLMPPRDGAAVPRQYDSGDDNRQTPLPRFLTTTRDRGGDFCANMLYCPGPSVMEDELDDLPVLFRDKVHPGLLSLDVEHDDDRLLLVRGDRLNSKRCDLLAEELLCCRANRRGRRS
jgi:hypothetical protein